MTSKLNGLGGCSSHRLQGAGAYFVGPTTGCTGDNTLQHIARMPM